jgi:hypothetical protein
MSSRFVVAQYMWVLPNALTCLVQMDYEAKFTVPVDGDTAAEERDQTPETHPNGKI